MKANTDSALSISDNLVVDSAGYFLRGDGATVNFTSAEANILRALIDAGKAGLSIRDTLSLFGDGVCRKSLHIVRTHISKIRKKTALFGRNRILLEWDKDRQRYILVALNLQRTY
ncbi:MAG: hypothetical protein EOP69_00240 [Spirochaetia bacterium]|nr:MAG: hypothetical protein EOP69_00240 [Spirochaetia bacterium]